ncbi:MAG: AI-2E family transporter [Bacilli bacterium]|nr:AI-2E family transporter [Bacilli bacterium]
MFKKEKKESEGINYRKLNELIKLSSKFMKLIYTLAILSLIFIGIHLLKELHILNTIREIISVLSAFFFGIILAWLLDPIVSLLQKKGVKRGIGVTFVYVILISIMILIGNLIIPAMGSQIKEMITAAPDTINNLTEWINHIINTISRTYNLDSGIVKKNIYDALSGFFYSFTVDGPTTIIRVSKSILSGGLTFIVGLLIGFYMLIDFDGVKKQLAKIVPKKHRKDMDRLTTMLNQTLRNYVYGTLMVMFILFICQSIGMRIAGMKAPMVFGLFCAITNIIPYLGPYIGGIPSVLIAFTISPSVGIGVLISVLICQGLESYLLTPTIMSKTMKLHPVTIIIGLLLFGHFFGIIGMLFATPIIACCKIIANFFIEKYELFKEDEEEIELEEVNIEQ